MFQNNELIYFIIKFPRIKKLCSLVRVFPVAHNQRTIFLETNKVADCGDSTIPVTNCTTALTAKFCRVKLDATYVQQLFNNHKATCKTTFNQLEPVAEVDNGVIIINDQTVEVQEADNSYVTISGTFLITFDKTIHVNGTTFVNEKAIATLYPGVPSTQFVNLTEDLEILSLPYLHRINLKNLGYIEKLHDDIQTRSIQGGSILIIIVIVVVIIFVIKKYKATKVKKDKIKRDEIAAKIIKAAEDGLNLRGGQLTHDSDE